MPKKKSEVDIADLAYANYISLKKQADQWKAKLDELEPKLQEAKQEALEAMLALRTKKTEAIDGMYITRSERVSLNITDEDQVLNWLVSNDFDTDSYLRLDPARVKSLAEQKLKEDGEVIPGTDRMITEYITVKKEK